MKPKSDAERKRDERKRMRDRGYVQRTVWVREQDWPRVQKYLQRIERERDT